MPPWDAIGQAERWQGSRLKQALRSAKHGHSLDLYQQVFEEEAMLDRRPRRVGGLEMPTVDVMKDIRGRRRILPRRSVALGQESPHLHHVLQASSQQFQGSVHVLQRLGTLRCHISASGRAAGQPPVRIDPHRAMQCAPGRAGIIIWPYP
jgi:hypothetical protein